MKLKLSNLYKVWCFLNLAGAYGRPEMSKRETAEEIVTLFCPVFDFKQTKLFGKVFLSEVNTSAYWICWLNEASVERMCSVDSVRSVMHVLEVPDGVDFAEGNEK